MIYFDVTKSQAAKHRSGLLRVSWRLRDELGDAATPVAWREGAFTPAGGGGAVRFETGDWLLTAELFSEEDRPGFREFIARKPCRLAAIFYDAIPLRFPHITWPQSVARHPDYLKMLAGFDRIEAISAASRLELIDWWRWVGVENPPPVDPIVLGADFNRHPRRREMNASPRPSLLMVGIIEPRKNQGFLIEVCEELWSEGLAFDLNLVGRVNPHFGPPLLKKIRQAAKHRPGLRYHAAAPDALVDQLYGEARAAVFPTIAEGCGLPVLEALWMGVPVVCNDLPVLRENAGGGGCLCVSVEDRTAWKDALRAVLTDDDCHRRLKNELVARELPTWKETAAAVRSNLGA